jgi:hypothetical protein
VARYYTENSIEANLVDFPSFPSQDLLEIHSDAGIIFRAGGKEWNVAIEYENGQQSTERYNSHLNAYYLKRNIHGVLYIAKEPGTRELVTRLDKPFCQDRSSKVFCSLLSDVLNPDRKLHFKNNSGNVFQLD